MNISKPASTLSGAQWAVHVKREFVPEKIFMTKIEKLLEEKNAAWTAHLQVSPAFFAAEAKLRKAVKAYSEAVQYEKVKRQVMRDLIHSQEKFSTETSDS